MKIISHSNRFFIVPAVIMVLVAGISFLCNTCSRPDGDNQILEKAGIQGGLIVHLGCDDGRFTAGLRAGDSYIVQGLTRNKEDLPAIRVTSANEDRNPSNRVLLPTVPTDPGG